jgi:hypothetical protein
MTRIDHTLHLVGDFRKIPINIYGTIYINRLDIMAYLDPASNLPMVKNAKVEKISMSR